MLFQFWARWSWNLKVILLCLIGAVNFSFVKLQVIVIYCKVIKKTWNWGLKWWWRDLFECPLMYYFSWKIIKINILKWILIFWKTVKAFRKYFVMWCFENVKLLHFCESFQNLTNFIMIAKAFLVDKVVFSTAFASIDSISSVTLWVSLNKNKFNVIS